MFRSVKNGILILLTWGALIFSSCLDEDDPGCSVCFEDNRGEINVKLTINEENPEVRLTLYEKNEGDKVKSKVTANTNVKFSDVRVGRYYVIAEYLVDGEEVKRRDSGKVIQDYDDCDCEDGGSTLSLNVRL